MLGIMSLMTRTSLDRDVCTACKAVTSVEGEGAWAWTTKLKEGVYFTPTTWMCECFRESWREVFTLATRLMKDRQLTGSTWPWYLITA